MHTPTEEEVKTCNICLGMWSFIVLHKELNEKLQKKSIATTLRLLHSSVDNLQWLLHKSVDNLQELDPKFMNKHKEHQTHKRLA